MRILVGFIAANVMMIVLTFLNHYVFWSSFPEFLMGWFSCAAWFIAMEIYEDVKSGKIKKIF